MVNQNDTRSLHQVVFDLVGTILIAESFPPTPQIQGAVVALIDQISSYNEEGRQLFPEVVMSTSIDAFIKQLPSHYRVPIGSGKISTLEFKKALKKCAPLAVNGWIIYIEIAEHNFSYGLISSDSSELSPLLYQHIVGDLRSSEINCPVIYIKNIGQSVVKIKGLNKEIYICLNLRDDIVNSDEHLNSLVSEITSSVDSSIQEASTNYLHRVLESSLQSCHGCLIGVVSVGDDALSTIRKGIPDASFLDIPIDFSELVKNFNENPSVESTTALRAYRSIIEGMLNSDGITIFTDDAKLIAFNGFIESDTGAAEDGVHGGARKRAYQAMCTAGIFSSCYYKSQDGPVEVWRNHDN
jgi:hypothetical protein